MEAADFLTHYSQKADQYLDRFFLLQEKEAAKISPLCYQMIRIYRDYLQGGKKIRGALTYLGYLSVGGKDEKVAYEASLAIEILHGFLLIHDDWIDQDRQRRGKPTVHRQYEEIFRQKHWRGDGVHWAAGMAVVLGDAGCFLAQQIISNLVCPDSLKSRASNYLSFYLLKTAYGEALDISLDFESEVSYQQILTMRELKTAHYTIVMPLVVGAVLAGASDSKIGGIEKYGLPVGIAFQLRDDELGLFGQEKNLGKSNLTDLLTGKKTILICKALENLAGEEKKFVLSVWGKKQASLSEIKKAKNLILKSGAFEFSQKFSRQLVAKGKHYLAQITPQPQFQTLLARLADFMIQRER